MNPARVPYPVPALPASSRAIIHLDILAANLQAIRARIGSGRGLMMAVKANAYGHGAVPVSLFAERNGLADWFGVASVAEGAGLRAAGVTSPILRLSPCLPQEVPVALDAGITLCVGSIAEADRVEAAAAARGSTAHVHLALDSGMRRIGAEPERLGDLAAHVRRRCPHVRVQGLFTHFPVSDTTAAEDVAFTLGQIGALRAGAAAAADALGYFPEFVHGANSGGVLAYPDSWSSMVRAGIMVYGYYPDPATPRTVPVRPVLEWRTRVTFVKLVRAGETVSYGRTWTAGADTWVATLPVGYADGYRRLLSGTGRVLANGTAYPVAGRVCMDQTMIALGPEPSLAVGDEVVLLGSSGEVSYDADDMAAQLGTISYEVLTLIGDRVDREYVS